MEKTIETIWKEGFLKNDALIAPKLNDLYNQKSIHIVDKFKRMYQINLIAIVVFAAVLLLVSFTTEMAYMGILMFILFNAVVIVNRRFSRSLQEIDKSQNSYQYLNSFDKWIKEMVLVNVKLSRYLYPYVFLSMIAGFWFGGFGGDVPGKDFVNVIIIDYPNTYLVFGVPLIGILGVVLVVGLLAFFGGRIGKWDLNIIYGRILKKLNVLINEMEELKS